MIWQGFAAVFALWLGIRCIAGRRGRLVLILGGRDDLCVFLQIEVQLIQTLGFAPEPVPVLPVKLMLELLDLEAERLDLIDQKRSMIALAALTELTVMIYITLSLPR